MDNFTIRYSGWEPEEQKLREALCTLGNGYFASRGTAEESKDDGVNYPGTYLAGGYNRATSRVAEKDIENEDLVNFPNWLYLNFRIGDGDWFSIENCDVLEYEQKLDMANGLLSRSFVVQDPEGRRIKIESQRFVSMGDMHNAALSWTLTALNWSGSVEVISELDGAVINNGVERYRELESQHLEPLDTRALKNGILLLVQTKQSNLVMAQAARTTVLTETSQLKKRKISEGNLSIAEHLFLEVKEAVPVTIEKVVALYTSRDKAISEPALDAAENVAAVPDFSGLLERHQQAWQKIWSMADISLVNGDKTQQLLRLHIFHILQTASPNSLGLDVGIPARGWHGEAYRGHIFWDELFIAPFFNLRFPEITRSLLMYRFYRLDQARLAAREAGYRGAMFPWQSGSNGREESQKIHLNPASGNWLPDHTYLQHHVNSAIAYNIWNYYKASADHQFLSFFGAEMFLSIADFWASKTSYNENKGRYEILGVVGPDEYHTAYPSSDQQGLKNNAYTNLLAAWVLQKAAEILEIIEKSNRESLLERLAINQEDLELWNEIATKMYVPFLDSHVISQFEGYETLAEFPWEAYREKYGNIQRLDRILEKEGDSPNNYKASKQADVLMLYNLFTEDELQEVFGKLGYTLDKDSAPRNLAYYLPRTSHGSTLSRLVFSWILSQYDEKESWSNFEALLVSDFEDIQGGTTPEGIHLGAMAGSLDLVQRCFCGITVNKDALWIKPKMKMVGQFQKIAFKIKYWGHWIALSFINNILQVAFEEGWSNSVHIGVNDQLYEFRKDEVKEFPISG